RIDDHDNGPSPAAADGDPAPSEPPATLFVDLRRIETRVGIEAHPSLSPRVAAHPTGPQAACRRWAGRYAVNVRWKAAPRCTSFTKDRSTATTCRRRSR